MQIQYGIPHHHIKNKFDVGILYRNRAHFEHAQHIRTPHFTSCPFSAPWLLILYGQKSYPTTLALRQCTGTDKVPSFSEIRTYTVVVTENGHTSWRSSVDWSVVSWRSTSAIPAVFRYRILGHNAASITEVLRFSTNLWNRSKTNHNFYKIVYNTSIEYIIRKVATG